MADKSCLNDLLHLAVDLELKEYLLHTVACLALPKVAAPINEFLSHTKSGGCL